MKKVLSILALVAMFAVAANAQAPTATPATAKKAKAAKKKTTKTTTAPASVPDEVSTPVAIPAKISGPVMTLDKSEIDYGTIAQGSDPLRKFKFKNTGSAPLVIKSAQGSCGCTVPSYKKEPINSGETSEIEVRYDTQRVGPFTKTVSLQTNEGEQPRVLVIKGVVEVKAADPSVPAVAPSIITTLKQ